MQTKHTFISKNKEINEIKLKNDDVLFFISSIEDEKIWRKFIKKGYFPTYKIGSESARKFSRLQGGWRTFWPVYDLNQNHSKGVNFWSCDNFKMISSNKNDKGEVSKICDAYFYYNDEIKKIRIQEDILNKPDQKNSFKLIDSSEGLIKIRPHKRVYNHNDQFLLYSDLNEEIVFFERFEEIRLIEDLGSGYFPLRILHGDKVYNCSSWRSGCIENKLLPLFLHEYIEENFSWSGNFAKFKMGPQIPKDIVVPKDIKISIPIIYNGEKSEIQALVKWSINNNFQENLSNHPCEDDHLIEGTGLNSKILLLAFFLFLFFLIRKKITK
ncbi:MAG: hypothetical protein GY909_06770 [Oligoflexia bacterium]|nr:hypothetical protein [Oligoflexia bacterium]